MGGARRRVSWLGIVGAALVLAVPVARGGVLLSQEEALALAFPDAEIESETVVLTEAQLAAVQAASGARLESKLFRYFTARRAGVVVGYGVIDTHVVRTLPEAFLAVLSPEGQLERVLLLAFHEPPEYQASERWLAQFKGRDVSSKGWRVGRDVHGLTGATLTAHAVTDAVRKVLALHAVVIRPRESG